MKRKRSFATTNKRRKRAKHDDDAEQVTYWPMLVPDVLGIIYGFLTPREGWQLAQCCRTNLAVWTESLAFNFGIGDDASYSPEEFTKTTVEERRKRRRQLFFRMESSRDPSLFAAVRDGNPKVAQLILERIDGWKWLSTSKIDELVWEIMGSKREKAMFEWLFKTFPSMEKREWWTPDNRYLVRSFIRSNRREALKWILRQAGVLVDEQLVSDIVIRDWNDHAGMLPLLREYGTFSRGGKEALERVLERLM